MRTFQSNNQEDLVIGADGRLSLIAGQPALAQCARQYMRTRHGEMIHQRNEGIPFEQLIWNGEANLPMFEELGRERLMQVPEVTFIERFDLRQENDVLRYEATLRTHFGEVTIDGDL